MCQCQSGLHPKSFQLWHQPWSASWHDLMPSLTYWIPMETNWLTWWQNPKWYSKIIPRKENHKNKQTRIPNLYLAGEGMISTHINFNQSKYKISWCNSKFTKAHCATNASDPNTSRTRPPPTTCQNKKGSLTLLTSPWVWSSLCIRFSLIWYRNSLRKKIFCLMTSVYYSCKHFG